MSLEDRITAALQAVGADVADLLARVGRTPAVQTAAFTATAGGDYLCDTRDGSFAVAPPASPIAGTKFTVRDYGRTFATNPLTVLTSTSKVLGVSQDYIVDTKDATRTFTYIDSLVGWMVNL